MVRYNGIVEETIRGLIADSIAAKEGLGAETGQIVATAEILIEALRAGKKILVCGNGGSAADALHMAGELVGRFAAERKGLPCIALTANVATLTAWSNDYEYDTVFARQVEALGGPGDVLVGITTSGESPSIVRAFEAAARQGLACVALNGRDGGAVGRLDGVTGVTVPAHNTQRIQECHILVIHAWCSLIERELFGA